MPEEAIAVDAGTELDAQVETVETDASTEVQDAVETPTEQGTEGQSGKATPTDPLKDAFSKLKGADQKAEAFLRKEFFSTKQKLQEAQEQIELLGGEEGIAAMQTELQEYSETLAQVAEGNPAAIDKVIEDSREGYLKLAEAALDKMPSVDPVRYEQALVPHVAQYLAEKGITETTNYALTLLKENRPQDAQRILEDMNGWLGRLSKLAEQKKQTPQDDPREKKIQEDRAALEREKGEAYQGKVNGSVAESINKEIAKHLVPLLKGKTLTQKQRQGIVSDAYTNIAKAIHGQQRTQQQLQAFMRKRAEPGEIARFLASKINSRDAEGKTLASRAIKEAWEGRGFAATAASNGAKAQVVQTKGKPRPEDIDWSKDEGRYRYMRGEATLKNGRTVKWNWDEV